MLVRPKAMANPIAPTFDADIRQYRRLLVRTGGGLWFEANRLTAPQNHCSVESLPLIAQFL